MVSTGMKTALAGKMDVALVKALYRKAGEKFGCADRIYMNIVYHNENIAGVGSNEESGQLKFSVYVPKEYSERVDDYVGEVLSGVSGYAPFAPDDVIDGSFNDKPEYDVYMLFSTINHPDECGDYYARHFAKCKSLAETLGVPVSLEDDRQLTREMFEAALNGDYAGVVSEFDPIV